MKKKNAFAVTIETILIFLLCSTVVIVCLQLFSDNLADMFSNDRNYKKLFNREASFGK